MAQDWSSLPADLVNCVADCLLATNDLDWYVDLRAVCHHWRAVTTDPGSNQHGPRFRPCRWVMLLDEDDMVVSRRGNTDGPLLFLNTATGRFLRGRLALLRGHDSAYIFITSTTGLLVLATRAAPHTVSVLNPFTCSLIRFAAPLPRYQGPRFTADMVGSSPTLILVSVSKSSVHWADPKSESFSVEEFEGHFPARRLPLIAAAINRGSVSVAKNIFDQLLSEQDEDEDCRCYAVVAGDGDMLAVLKRWRGIDIFKVDAAGNMMERVENIGSQALFLGIRCFAVDTDTDCFPTVEPNCAYFQSLTVSAHMDYVICKFNIGTYDDEDGPELVSAHMDYVRPFTLTQFLSNTMDVPRHPLPLPTGGIIVMSALEICGCADVERYEEYVDYVYDELEPDDVDNLNSRFQEILLKLASEQ